MSQNNQHKRSFDLFIYTVFADAALFVFTLIRLIPLNEAIKVFLIISVGGFGLSYLAKKIENAKKRLN